MKVYDRNASAANQAGVVLLAELGPDGPAKPAPGQIDDRSDFRELFRQFQDKEGPDFRLDPD